MARKAKPTITDILGRTRSATRASWGKIRTLPSGRLQASYVGPDEQRYPAPMTFDNRSDAEAWLTGSAQRDRSRRVALPADKAAERERSARTPRRLCGNVAEGSHERPR